MNLENVRCRLVGYESRILLEITPVFDDASRLIIDAVRQMADLFRPIVESVMSFGEWWKEEFLSSSMTDPRDFHE